MQTEYKSSLGASWQAINTQEISLGGLGIATLTMNSDNKDKSAPLRLIAAAPELLEALEACLARLQIVDTEAIKNSYHLPVIKAAAAINKAKGE
jgi:hypothetical protein